MNVASRHRRAVRRWIATRRPDPASSGVTQCRIEHDRRSGREHHVARPSVAADPVARRAVAAQTRLGQLAVLPRDVDSRAASHPDTRQASRRPPFRECGQESDFVQRALHQQLRDAGGAAQVAVDLKRRVQVEHVRQRALREQEPQVGVRALAVTEPGPQRHPPGRRPAGAAVAAQLEARLRGGRERGRALDVDALPGIQRVEVRDVAMCRLRFGVVLDPFLQLSARADLQWRQARAGAPPDVRRKSASTPRMAAAFGIARTARSMSSRSIVAA